MPTQFTHLRLTNWRNFRAVGVALGERVFVLGPNASGKPNLLDAFRVLRDIAMPEGRLMGAVEHRGGLPHLRLHLLRPPEARFGSTAGHPITEPPARTK